MWIQDAHLSSVYTSMTSGPRTQHLANMLSLANTLEERLTGITDLADPVREAVSTLIASTSQGR